MNLFLWIALSLFVLGIIWSIFDRDYGWSFPWGSTIMAAVIGFIGLMVWGHNTPEAVAQRARDEAARKAALIPHVIREFDGCKVYRWRNSDSDHWHYVTKCPTEVTTESARSVPRKQGKTTVYDTVPEIIKTER